MKLIMIVPGLACVMVVAGLSSCDPRSHEPEGFTLVEKSKIPDSMMVNTDSSDTLFDFHLTYCYAGMGHNMGTMQPFFEVIDSVFVYTSRQTSRVGGEMEKPDDTLAVGFFRESSRDSILNLLSDFGDTIITKNNFGISDGGMISVDVKTKKRRVLLRQVNCYDETTDKIVQILNTYIANKQKLIIHHHAPRDYGIEF